MIWDLYTIGYALVVVIILTLMVMWFEGVFSEEKPIENSVARWAVVIVSAIASGVGFFYLQKYRMAAQVEAGLMGAEAQVGAMALSAAGTGVSGAGMPDLAARAKRIQDAAQGAVQEMASDVGARAQQVGRTAVSEATGAVSEAAQQVEQDVQQAASAAENQVAAQAAAISEAAAKSQEATGGYFQISL